MIAVEKHFEVPTFDYWIGASFDLKGRMWRKECFLLSPEVEKHAVTCCGNFELGGYLNLNTLLHAIFENLCSSNSA